MNKLFVVGNPIKHSLSPEIHNFWMKKYKIKGTYEKLELNTEIEKFKRQKKGLIQRIRQGEVTGVNITVPFKQKFNDVLDKLDNSAKYTKAINTIYKENNKIIGANTDGVGFCRSLLEDFEFVIPSTIFILGAGGAVYGILSELLKYKPKIVYLCNRTRNKAEVLANHFSKINLSEETKIVVDDISFNPPSDVKLFINASYIGMQDNFDIKEYFRNLSIECFVYDINYNKNLTIFNLMARKIGIGNLRNVNGKHMLVRQAAESFTKWFGVKIVKADIEEVLNLINL